MTRDGEQYLLQMKINKKSSACEEHQFCTEIRMVYINSRDLNVIRASPDNYSQDQCSWE